MRLGLAQAFDRKKAVMVIRIAMTSDVHQRHLEFVMSLFMTGFVSLVFVMSFLAPALTL
jgi:hypothetical protein